MKQTEDMNKHQQENDTLATETGDPWNHLAAGRLETAEYDPPAYQIPWSNSPEEGWFQGSHPWDFVTEEQKKVEAWDDSGAQENYQASLRVRRSRGESRHLFNMHLGWDHYSPPVAWDPLGKHDLAIRGAGIMAGSADELAASRHKLPRREKRSNRASVKGASRVASKPPASPQAASWEDPCTEEDEAAAPPIASLHEFPPLPPLPAGVPGGQSSGKGAPLTRPQVRRGQATGRLAGQAVGTTDATLANGGTLGASTQGSHVVGLEDGARGIPSPQQRAAIVRQQKVISVS